MHYKVSYWLFNKYLEYIQFFNCVNICTLLEIYFFPNPVQTFFNEKSNLIFTSDLICLRLPAIRGKPALQNNYNDTNTNTRQFNIFVTKNNTSVTVFVKWS